MNRVIHLSRACLLAFCVVLASGCSSSQRTPAEIQTTGAARALIGGCAGTLVSEAEPPAWTQGGWHSHVKGTPWSVPWAIGTPGDAIAFIFAGELVAGASPRINGTNNKILWVTSNAEFGFKVDGHPLGRSLPVVSVAGGASIVDVPTAGCWTFRLTRTSDGQKISTINLEVLPHGTLPTQA